jgi:hypothetical protein
MILSFGGAGLADKRSVCKKHLMGDLQYPTLGMKPWKIMVAYGLFWTAIIPTLIMGAALMLLG